MRPDDRTPPHVEGSGYAHWLGKITYGGGNQAEWAARMYSLNNEGGRNNRISGYAFNRTGGQGVGSYFEDRWKWAVDPLRPGHQHRRPRCAVPHGIHQDLQER